MLRLFLKLHSPTFSIIWSTSRLTECGIIDPAWDLLISVRLPVTSMLHPHGPVTFVHISLPIDCSMLYIPPFSVVSVHSLLLNYKRFPFLLRNLLIRPECRRATCGPFSALNSHQLKVVISSGFNVAFLAAWINIILFNSQWRTVRRWKISTQRRFRSRSLPELPRPAVLSWPGTICE